MNRVLTTSETQQFIDDGYVHVAQAFSRGVASAIRERIWGVLEAEHGVRQDDPATWKKEQIHIKRGYEGAPFSEAWTPRLLHAVGELVGPDRFEPPGGLGWWPVSFPGFAKSPWRPPELGWHVDGTQFHHHIHSRDQGLLTILILSDIDAGDGGTAIVPGSHKIVARVLAEAEPQGVDVHELIRRVNPLISRDGAIEATGGAGDAMLMHPFMLHSRSPNTGTRVRFICNPCIRLKADMTLDPNAAGERSVLEQSIMATLREN